MMNVGIDEGDEVDDDEFFAAAVELKNRELRVLCSCASKYQGNTINPITHFIKFNN